MAIVLLLVGFLACNWLLYFLLTVKTIGMNLSGKSTFSAALVITERAFHWAWFELFIIINIFGVIFLSLHVGHIYYLPFLLAGCYLVLMFLGQRIGWIKHVGNEGVLPAKFWAPSAVIMASFIFLDLFLHFRYALMIAIMFNCVIIFFVLFGKVIQKSRGTEVKQRLYSRLRIVIFLVSISWYLCYTNLTAEGSTGFFGIQHYPLRPSKRASINSLGFRGPEFEVPKKAGLFRIVTIGDSATYGYFMPAELNYSRRLEEKLRMRNDGRNYEVINGGVIGFTLTKMLDRLNKKVAPLQPDLVFLLTGGNDWRLPQDESYDLELNKFVNATHKIGATIVLASYPGIDCCALSNWRIELLAEQEKLDFIDLHHLIRIQRPNEGLMFDENHPNIKGHDFIADVLLDYLVSHNLLQRPGKIGFPESATVETMMQIF
jgi:lysophospholipase L1-like esterase